MSSWTYVKGMIYVSPMGRTQAEKRYILDTVLEHLPIVSGSEGCMNAYVIKPKGDNGSSSVDEFGFNTNNLTNWYGNKSHNGWLRYQSTYIIVLDGSLRDREFDQTHRELQKFLCRLAKRISVDKIIVEVSGWDKNIMIDNSVAYNNMFEHPSWSCMNEDKDNPKSNWCEYLMWKEPPECYLWQ